MAAFQRTPGRDLWHRRTTGCRHHDDVGCLMLSQELEDRAIEARMPPPGSDKERPSLYLSFWRSNVISCERVATGREKSQLYLSFWRSNLISCERVAPGREKSQLYYSFWRSNVISCETVAPGREKSQLYFSFWRSRFFKRAREHEGKRECDDVKM